MRAAFSISFTINIFIYSGSPLPNMRKQERRKDGPATAPSAERIIAERIVHIQENDTPA
jgi:hypothetical protein